MNTDNKVLLTYKEGSSDKVYQVELTPEDEAKDLWKVNFAYGRRGSTLQIGTKTQKPVKFEQAVKIMSKLVVEKQSKGYKVENATASVPTPVEKIQTGFYPQLLKPIEESDVDTYLEDEEFMAQEKIDGERRMLIKRGDDLTGSNRKGQAVPLTQGIMDDLKLRTDYDDFVLDGEQIGDEFYAFDILVMKESVQHQPFVKRYAVLKELMSNSNFQFIRLVKAVSGFVPKVKLYKDLLQANKEGIVFKNKNAAYVPGRNSGTQFKRKFYETASFLVTAVNDKRSVQIAVTAQDAILPVGNVTIPVNHKIPDVHNIIEVRYLYAYKGGSVYQPVYLGLRTDLEPKDCSVSQLKYKGEDNGEDS